MAAIALVGFASAYTLTGYAWPEERLPVEVHWTGEQGNFTREQLQAAIEGAGAAWTDVALPGGFRIVEDPDAAAWFDAGGHAVVFGDPDGVVDGGAPSQSFYGPDSGETAEWGGVVYDVPRAQLLVFAASDSWLPDSEISAGGCADEFSLQSALTHQFGHVLGLGHSCEEGEACAEDLAAATMAWSTSQCDTTQSTLAQDDIDGLAAIYDPAPSSLAVYFACRTGALGPLSVDCAITGPPEADGYEATWDFGDATTATGPSTEHVYAEEGVYTVEVCLSAAPPACASHEVNVEVDDPAPPGEVDGGCGCAAVDPATGGALSALALVGLHRRRRGLSRRPQT